MHFLKMIILKGKLMGFIICVDNNLQDNLQDLLLIASLHGQYDQNCLASIVVVLLPV